jgi:hypothetical protein
VPVPVPVPKHIKGDDDKKGPRTAPLPDRGDLEAAEDASRDPWMAFGAAAVHLEPLFLGLAFGVLATSNSFAPLCDARSPRSRRPEMALRRCLQCAVTPETSSTKYVLRRFISDSLWTGQSLDSVQVGRHPAWARHGLLRRRVALLTDWMSCYVVFRSWGFSAAARAWVDADALCFEYYFFLAFELTGAPRLAALPSEESRLRLSQGNK